MGINMAALRESTNKGQTVIHSQQRDEVPFFHLQKDENKTGDSVFETYIRLVMKPETKGFAYRVMHPHVGRPGKEPKNFACGKFLGKECDICDCLSLVGDEGLMGSVIDFPVEKDGIIALRPMSKSAIIARMAPHPLLITIIHEPRFAKDPEAPDEIKGLQKWWLTKKTLVKSIKNILLNAPTEEYYTDPDEGHAIKVTFNGNNSASEMYSAEASKVMRVKPELVALAPDPELFAPGLKTPKEVQAKLKEMLPELQFS